MIGDSRTSEFEKLATDFFTPVYRYARWRTTSPEAAWELTFQAFLRGFRTWNDARTRSSTSARIFTSIRDVIADEQRAHFEPLQYPHRAKSHSPAPDRSADPNATHLNKRLEELDSAIRKLIPIQQEMLALRFAGGLSTTQISEVVVLSEGEVKMALYGMLTQLAGPEADGRFNWEVFAAMDGLIEEALAHGKAETTDVYLRMLLGDLADLFGEAPHEAQGKTRLQAAIRHELARPQAHPGKKPLSPMAKAARWAIPGIAVLLVVSFMSSSSTPPGTDAAGVAGTVAESDEGSDADEGGGDDGGAELIAEGKAHAEKTCTACHGFENLTNASYEPGAWGDVVDRMKGKGCNVPTEEEAALLAFLNSGQANGKSPASGGGDQAVGLEQTKKVCAQCHGLENLINATHEGDAWKDVVTRMKGKGCNMTAEEESAIAAFLAGGGKDQLE